jgi:transglutaminase-like putative cysteine protease
MAPTAASEAPPPGAPIASAQAAAVRLEVEHLTRYEYTASVVLAHHLAHLRPRGGQGQAVAAAAIAIDPAPDHECEGTDAFGNPTLHFSLVKPHERLCVRSTAVVAIAPGGQGFDADPDPGPDPDSTPAWEALSGALRYVARAPFAPAVEFVQPSPFVPRLPEVQAWAAKSFAPGRPVARVAIELMHRVHEGFTYRSASTQVDTPLAVFFRQRAGVCQDFAHLLIAALRGHGLPARYVSGYLLTHAPGEGGAAMLGADASHAWVQVGLGEGRWLDLDPTNALRPSTGHVRVAIGRDYGDVAPLRGVIRGGGRHRLHVEVRTRRLDPPAAEQRNTLPRPARELL